MPIRVPSRKFIPVALLAAVLTACGGSDGTDAPAPTPAPNTPAPSTPAPSPAPSPSPTPSPNPSPSPAPAPQTHTTFCDYAVAPKRIQGVVTGVTDGDTLKVDNRYTVRLDSIDAPEMRQTYGVNSKANLSNLVQGRQVTVTYGKTDRYGRIVGQVFDSSCNLINLQQVQQGAAWYYAAYRCEISAPLRSAYAQAQDQARAARRGLWSQGSPTAPWVWRNGSNPQAPTCESDDPYWEEGLSVGDEDDPTPAPNNPPSTNPPATNPPNATPPGTTPPTPRPPATTPPRSCAPVWVNGYYRANGRYVRGHYRRPPGCS